MPVPQAVEALGPIFSMRRLAAAAMACPLLLTLPGCGGGGGSNDVSAAASNAPAVGRTVDYQVTETDNSNNTIPWQLEYKVLSSSPDGSYSESAIGSAPAVTVNGTRYGTVNQVYRYDTNHATLGYTTAGSPAVTCTYAVPQAPLPTSLPAGTAWPDIASHISCSNGTSVVSDRTSGTVVDIETVTVPAGTFSAQKSQYERVLSNTANSQVTTEDFTVWLDTVTGRQVQLTIDYRYTGATFTNGYAVHQVRQLLSVS